MSLPIIFVLGTLVNKKYGSVYSLKLLTSSWLMGYGLSYSKLYSDTKEYSPTSTIAAALVAQTIVKSGLPFGAAAA